MNRWFEHKQEIFNLENFTIICKGSDCGDDGEDVHQILLSTNKCNTEKWIDDEYSTLSFDTEKERDKIFEYIKSLII